MAVTADHGERLRDIIKQTKLPESDGMLWFDRILAFGNPVRNAYPIADIEGRHHPTWNNVYNVFNSGSNVSPSIERRIQYVFERLDPFLVQPFPRVEFLPTFRQINDHGAETYVPSGLGLATLLSKLDRPDFGPNYTKFKAKFDAIVEFFREIVGNDSAMIQVPDSKKTINVTIDGRMLPIESLGTGIHQVLIMAATATATADQILCVEEPELHLHPILQRKLLAYLSKNTTNQYFITTHSSALLDQEGAVVFHISLQDGQSTVQRTDTSGQKWGICRDLGNRGSDLLQSNCVIWVEGPSDRIYLKHWIHKIDSSLIEGVHFSVMFYGGSLLSHLSGDNPEVVEFISLVGINRNSAIVMDSDREDSSDSINATKDRIIGEFNIAGRIAWLTAGREIENYLPTELLAEAIKASYPNRDLRPLAGDFADVLPKMTPKSSKTVDKVRIAQAVVKRPADLSMLDLRAKVREIVKFIREANHNSIEDLVEDETPD